MDDPQSLQSALEIHNEFRFQRWADVQEVRNCLCGIMPFR